MLCSRAFIPFKALFVLKDFEHDGTISEEEFYVLLVIIYIFKFCIFTVHARELRGRIRRL